MPKRALITGIAGQIGSHLADFLLAKGYEVHGVVRRSSLDRLDRIAHLVYPNKQRVTIHAGDLTDQGSLTAIVGCVRPDEIYNLAAQSFVGASWSQPVLTADVTGVGAARLLEAVRFAYPSARVYQASTSEMFGKVHAPIQNENTPFHPRSPYAVAKVYAHHLAINYRESYGMFVCAGICFNCEGPRRGVEFVTRKVTKAAAATAHAIRNGLPAPRLKLGNLDACRDWGYAVDYVDAMWRMLQRDEPEEFVIATGESHSVRDLCRAAYAHVGLNWAGYVDVDAALVRPADVNVLLGDAGKAKDKLGWSATTRFDQLVPLMVEADVALLR